MGQAYQLLLLLLALVALTLATPVLDLLETRYSALEHSQTLASYSFTPFEAHVHKSGEHKRSERFRHPNGYIVDYSSHMKTLAPILTLHTHPHVSDVVVVHPMSAEVAESVSHPLIEEGKEYPSSLDLKHHVGISFAHEEAAEEFEEFLQRIVANGEHLEDDNLPWPLFIHPSTSPYFALAGADEPVLFGKSAGSGEFLLSHSIGQPIDQNHEGSHDALPIPPVIRLDEHGGIQRRGKHVHIAGVRASPYSSLVSHSNVSISADPPAQAEPGYSVHTIDHELGEGDLAYAARDSIGDDDYVIDDEDFSVPPTVSVQSIDPTGAAGRILQQKYWTFDHQFGIFLNYDKKADYAPPIDLLAKAPEWLTTLGGGGELILQLIDTYAVARAGIRVQFDAGITGVSYFKAELIGDLGAGVGYLFEVVFDTDELNPWISVGGTILPPTRVFQFMIPAGPIVIPVSLDLGFGAGAGVSMRGGFRHSASATAGLKIRYGVEYTKNNGFQKINKYSPPTLKLDAGQPDFYFDYLDLDLLANVTMVPKVFNLGPHMVSMWDLKMRFTVGGDQCAPGSLSYSTYLLGDLSMEIPAVRIPFLSGRVDLGEFLPLPWYMVAQLFVTQLTCPFCGGCLGLQDLFNAFKNTTPVISARPEFVSLSAFAVDMPEGTLFDKELDPYVRADLVCLRTVNGNKDKTVEITLQSGITVTMENDSSPFFHDVIAFQMPQDLDTYPDCHIKLTLYDDGGATYLTKKVLFSTCPVNKLRCSKAWTDTVTNASLAVNVDFWPEVEPSAWTDPLNYLPDVPRFYRMKIPEGTTTLALAGSRRIPKGEGDGEIDVGGGDTSDIEDKFAGNSAGNNSQATQAKMIFTAVPDGCGAPSVLTTILDPYLEGEDLMLTPVITLPTENKGDVVDLWIHRVKIKKSNNAFNNNTEPQVKTRIKYLYADYDVVTPFASLKDASGDDMFPPTIKEDKWFDYFDACPTANTTVCQPNSIRWSFPEASFDSMEFLVHDGKKQKNVFRFVANDIIDYTRVGEVVTVSSQTTDAFRRVEGDAGDSAIEIRYMVRRATEYVIGAKLAPMEKEADISIVGMPHQIPKYAGVGSLGASVPSLAFGMPVYEHKPEYEGTLREVISNFNLEHEELEEKLHEISHHSLLDLDEMRKLDDLYLEHHEQKIKTLSFGAEDDSTKMEIPPPLSGQNLVASSMKDPDLGTVSTPLNTGGGAMVFLDPQDRDNQDVSMVLELTNPTSGWVEVQTLHPEGQPFPSIGGRPGLAVTTKQVRPIIGAVVKKQEEEKVKKSDDDDDSGSDYFDEGKSLSEYGAGHLQARMWLRVYSEKAFRGRLFMLPYTLAEAGKPIGLMVGDAGQHVIEVRVEMPFDAFYVERPKDAAADEHKFSLAFTPEEGDMFSANNRISVTFEKGEVRTVNPYAVSSLRTLLLAEQGTVTNEMTFVPYGIYTAKSTGSSQLPYEGGKFLLSVESLIFGKESRQRYLRVRSEAACGINSYTKDDKDTTPYPVDEKNKPIGEGEPLAFPEELWPDWHDTGLWPSDLPPGTPATDDSLKSYAVTYSQVVPIGHSTDVLHVRNDEPITSNMDADEYGITAAKTEFFIVDVVKDLEKEPVDGEHWSTGGDSHLVFEKVPIKVNQDNAERAVLEFIVDSRETNLVGTAMLYYDTAGFLANLPLKLLDPAEDREVRTPKTASGSDTAAFMRQIVPLKYIIDRVRVAGTVADDSEIKFNIGVKTRMPSYFNLRLRMEPTDEELKVVISQTDDQADENKFTIEIPNNAAVAFDPAGFLAAETLRELGAQLAYPGYEKKTPVKRTPPKKPPMKTQAEGDNEKEDDQKEDESPLTQTDPRLAGLEKAFRVAGFANGLEADFDDYLIRAEVRVPVELAGSGFNAPSRITFKNLPGNFTSSGRNIQVEGSFMVAPVSTHGVLFYTAVVGGSLLVLAGLGFGLFVLLRYVKKVRGGRERYASF